MSAMNLETYTNADVIAVSQDSLGKQGTRVVGGPLAGQGGSHAAHVAKCASSPTAAEQWTTHKPVENYLMNAGNSMCVNSDDCAADLIYFACVHTGVYGARFSTEVYTRGCHWFPRLLV
jgi:hypothetical protein